MPLSNILLFEKRQYADDTTEINFWKKIKERSLKELTQPKPWKIMKPRMCQMMETEKGCQFCFIVLWYTCKSICEKITVNVLLYITAIAAVFNN